MESFNELFNLFRIRSGYSTFGEFGKSLAEEGYIYEDSIFSKWKSGERVPKDRSLALAMIRTFVKGGGILDPEEANLFLSTLDFRPLDVYEMRIFGERNYESNGFYSAYNPLVEPNMLFQQVPISEKNTKFVHLQEISKEEQAYWSYQIRCGISDYYSKLSNGQLSIEEVFRSFSFDRYDRADVTDTVIAITEDPHTNREYLTGVLRLCKGNALLNPAIEVLEYYGFDGSSFHENHGLRIEEVGDVNRLIIPHWAHASAPFLLNKMQLYIEHIAAAQGVKLLYVTLSQVIVEFVRGVGIPVTKVDNAFLYHKKPRAEVMYSEAFKKSHQFPLYWYEMDPALYVFSNFGVIKDTYIT